MIRFDEPLAASFPVIREKLCRFSQKRLLQDRLPVSACAFRGFFRIPARDVSIVKGHTVPFVFCFLFRKLFFPEPRLQEIIRRLSALSSMGACPRQDPLPAALITWSPSGL